MALHSAPIPTPETPHRRRCRDCSMVLWFAGDAAEPLCRWCLRWRTIETKAARVT